MLCTLRHSIKMLTSISYKHVAQTPQLLYSFENILLFA